MDNTHVGVCSGKLVVFEPCFLLKVFFRVYMFKRVLAEPNVDRKAFFSDTRSLCDKVGPCDFGYY